MENKEEKVEKVEEVKNEKVEEPKFSKVTGKDLKKEKDMDSIDSKKEKKKSKKKTENKEKGGNKVGYWVGGIALLLIVLAIVTALILLPETPEKTVEGMLNSLKNGDFESVSKYVDYGEIISLSQILQDSDVDEETQVLLFDKLSWNILKVEKDENTASVEIEITNKDFDQVISNYTQEALRIAFSGASFTVEDQNNQLKEELKDEGLGTQTVTTTMQLVKQNGTWKVQVDESLVDALLPGLQEALNSLNQIING